MIAKFRGIHSPTIHQPFTNHPRIRNAPTNHSPFTSVACLLYSNQRLGLAGKMSRRPLNSSGSEGKTREKNMKCSNNVHVYIYNNKNQNDNKNNDNNKNNSKTIYNNNNNNITEGKPCGLYISTIHGGRPPSCRWG